MASISLSQSSIVARTSGVVVTVTGTSTAFSGTPFTISGGLGAAIISQTVTDSTHASLTIAAGALGNGTTLTVTDTGSAATATLTLTAPALGTMIIGGIGNSIMRGYLQVGTLAFDQMVTSLAAEGFTTTGSVNRGTDNLATGDWLPGSTNLTNAKTAFVSAGVTHVVISLQTNDLWGGASGSNVGIVPATYGTNLRSIVRDLLTSLTGIKVIILRAIWTKPNAVPATTTTITGPTGNAVTLSADPEWVYQQYTLEEAKLCDGVFVFHGGANAFGFSKANALNGISASFYATDKIHVTDGVTLGKLWAQDVMQALAPARQLRGGALLTGLGYTAAPSAPSTTAVPATSTSVALTITAASSGQTAPQTCAIQRATDSGFTVGLTTVQSALAFSGATATFTDTGLTTATTYYYRATGTNAAGTSANGSTGSATPGVAGSYTTSLSASSAASGVPVTATFTPVGGSWPTSEAITLTNVSLTGAWATGTGGTVSGSVLTPTPGSAAATAIFTPSAASAGTINSTTSPAMTNTSGGQTYTATSGSTLLLDSGSITTSAAFAFSLRKLKTGVTAAIRVQRSSDSTQQDIGFDGSGNLDTATMLAWVGAGNTGYVMKLYDQSGNGKDATAASTALAPVIVNAGTLVVEGSLPAMTWVSGKCLTFTSTALGTAQTILTTVRSSQGSPTTAYCIVGGGGVSNYVALQNDVASGDMIGWLGDNTRNSYNTSGSQTVDSSYTWVRSGATGAWYKGATLQTSALNNLSSGGTLTLGFIGGQNGGTGTATPWLGSIQEVIGFAAALAGSELTAATGSHTYWGT